MGLNFYVRPPRAELDPPSELVEASMPEFRNSGEELILNFQDEVLTGVRKRLEARMVGYPGREAR